MLAYRALLSVFAAGVLAPLVFRDRALLRARLGRVRPRDGGAHVWVHGASNGELAALRPVIEALVSERPDLRLLVTANTATGVDLVRGWALPRTEAHPAPLDLASATRRVLRDWRVRAHLTAEAELWPNRMTLCGGAGLPVLVIAGRMSEGTARLWSRLPGAARPALAAVTRLWPQDDASAGRFAALGLAAERIGPVVNLKALYRPDPLRVPDTDLRRAFPRDRTWLAASTHAPEEEIVIEAHRRALRHDPGLRLILAPRHPRRGDEIAAMLSAAGLDFARRSTGDPVDRPVLLADTMGEMPLWYALAGRVFIGGSLSDRGGHTPYEPAHFGCALLHGPDTANFAAAYDALDTAGAASRVTDAETLAAALRALSGPDAQAAAGRAAAVALPGAGGADALIDAVLAAV